MAQAQIRAKLTEDEYLALERAAETKSEFLDGEMFAMAGASWAHNRIVANLIRHLGNLLESGTCEALPSDLRVHIPATGLFAYPDVTVICGEPEFLDDRFDTLINPAVLIEVLSETTASYDLGAKFRHYRSLPSLQEILFIDQATLYVVHSHRQGSSWVLTETRDPDGCLQLPSLDVELPVARVYEGIEFDDASRGEPSAPIGPAPA